MFSREFGAALRLGYFLLWLRVSLTSDRSAAWAESSSSEDCGLKVNVTEHLARSCLPPSAVVSRSLVFLLLPGLWPLFIDFLFPYEYL